MPPPDSQLTMIGGAVLGGGSMGVADYANFLAEHYLADYLPHGGAAVKLAVAGSDTTTSRLHDSLKAAAHDQLFVALDAETTKLSQIDQIFFAVSRAIDWQQLAQAVARNAYDDIGFPAAASVKVADVAALHEMDARELYRSVRRKLEQTLLGDLTLTRELRRAVLRLAQVELGSGDVDRQEHDAVLAWLTGEKVSVVALRPALIHSKIGRHNARDLLLSVSRLLLQTGGGGLVLLLDGARLAETRRPPAEQRTGIYYSKAAVLDAFEVLRQLIDATDDLRGVLAIMVVPPEVITDESRGLPAYDALRLRVADEVRDRRRANPFAALVRLEVRLEAV